MVNQREVEDSAPKFGLGPHMEARFAAGSLGLSREAGQTAKCV